MSESAFVTLEEVLAAASMRFASLVPETSGYLVLAVGDATSRLPLELDDRAILVTTEGGVTLTRRGNVVSAPESARLLRNMLARLLAVSAGTMPGLATAAVERPESARGADAVVDEVEAALIPVNRNAARRALARLARETLRCKASGKLKRALQAMASRLVKEPKAQPSEAVQVASGAATSVAASAASAPQTLPAAASDQVAVVASSAQQTQVKATEPQASAQEVCAQVNEVPSKINHGGDTQTSAIDVVSPAAVAPIEVALLYEAPSVDEASSQSQQPESQGLVMDVAVQAAVSIEPVVEDAVVPMQVVPSETAKTTDALLGSAVSLNGRVFSPEPPPLDVFEMELSRQTQDYLFGLISGHEVNDEGPSVVESEKFQSDDHEVAKPAKTNILVAPPAFIHVQESAERTPDAIETFLVERSPINTSIAQEPTPTLVGMGWLNATETNDEVPTVLDAMTAFVVLDPEVSPEAAAPETTPCKRETLMWPLGLAPAEPYFQQDNEVRPCVDETPTNVLAPVEPVEQAQQVEQVVAAAERVERVEPVKREQEGPVLDRMDSIIHQAMTNTCQLEGNGTGRVDELLDRFASRCEANARHSPAARGLKTLAGLDPTPTMQQSAQKADELPLSESGPMRLGSNSRAAAYYSGSSESLKRSSRALWLALVVLALVCAVLVWAIGPERLASLTLPLVQAQNQ